jgi:hypothetical protein
MKLLSTDEQSGSTRYQEPQRREARLYMESFEWSETKSAPEIALSSVSLPAGLQAQLTAFHQDQVRAFEGKQISDVLGAVRTIAIGNDLENK